MHPELFKIGQIGPIGPIGLIGPITIYSYGVMLALAFGVGIYLARERARSAGISSKVIMDLSVYILLASIVGARLLYVLTNLDEYREQPLTAIFSRYGFVFYGGLIFAIIVSIWYLRRQKLPVWQIADVLAPSIPIGQAIGRIGCFLNGCCYGKPTTLPWGVRVPGRDPLDLTPLHPTQGYEAIGDLIIFSILTCLWKRRKFEGQIFLMYLMLYSILRFVIEMYRGDNPYLLFNLTLSQILSILLGSFAMTVMVMRISKK